MYSRPVTVMRIMFTTSAIGIALSRIMNLSHQGRSIEKHHGHGQGAEDRAPSAGRCRRRRWSRSMPGMLIRLPWRNAATPSVCSTNVLQMLASVCSRQEHRTSSMFGSGNMKIRKPSAGPGPANDVQTADQHEHAEDRRQKRQAIDRVHAVLGRNQPRRQTDRQQPQPDPALVRRHRAERLPAQPQQPSANSGTIQPCE